ncbi:MAG: glycogen/starch synthase, partial [Methanomassiliicoccales archaeon]
KFSRAVCQFLSAAEYDVIHCNDWQTGYVPLMLKQDKIKIGSVFAIHNIEFQGLSTPDVLDQAGIDRSHFHMEGVEFYGKASSLKAGIVYSDRLVTVSPRYAAEITTSEFGAGMEGIIKKHSIKLSGILNGIDYDVWNPVRDTEIYSNYSHFERSGKTRCKSALLHEFSLPQSSRPLFAFVGRIERQKGVDILIEVLDGMGNEWFAVILGTGDAQLVRKLNSIATSRGNVRFVNRFDEKLAHRIYAGADILVMPSRYEPCGLGQMIAMRYGTVPVVREVGGLADTVSEFDGEDGTGFLFRTLSKEELKNAMQKAAETMKQKEKWNRVVKNCMMRDFSWEKSAREYISLYEELSREVKAAGAT